MEKSYNTEVHGGDTEVHGEGKWSNKKIFPLSSVSLCAISVNLSVIIFVNNRQVHKACKH